MPEEPGETGEDADRDQIVDDETSTGRSGISFSLPPITLPPLFPDHMEIRLPVPGFRYATRLSSGWVLLVALGFDVADALFVSATTGWVALLRTLGGLLIAVSLARGVGLLYLWEVLAVLLGYASVTVAPTLGAIVGLWLWRSRD